MQGYRRVAACSWVQLVYLWIHQSVSVLCAPLPTRLPHLAASIQARGASTKPFIPLGLVLPKASLGLTLSSFFNSVPPWRPGLRNQLMNVSEDHFFDLYLSGTAHILSKMVSMTPVFKAFCISSTLSIPVTD